MNELRLIVGSLDSPPVERLRKIAIDSGLTAAVVKDTCTGPGHHKGKPLSKLYVKGSQEELEELVSGDPGMGFDAVAFHGVHVTGRRWWTLSVGPKSY